jgi:hypothetical protein
LPKVRKSDAPKGDGAGGVPLGVMVLSGGGLGRSMSVGVEKEVAATAPEPGGSFLLNMLRSEKLMRIACAKSRKGSLQVEVSTETYSNNKKLPVNLIHNHKYSLSPIQLNSF